MFRSQPCGNTFGVCIHLQLYERHDDKESLPLPPPSPPSPPPEDFKRIGQYALAVNFGIVSVLAAGPADLTSRFPPVRLIKGTLREMSCASFLVPPASSIRNICGIPCKSFSLIDYARFSADGFGRRRKWNFYLSAILRAVRDALFHVVCKVKANKSLLSSCKLFVLTSATA